MHNKKKKVSARPNRRNKIQKLSKLGGTERTVALLHSTRSTMPPPSKTVVPLKEKLKSCRATRKSQERKESRWEE